MNRGFYTIMLAQFFSSLADNALLIACMAVLAVLKSPAWMTPLLKLFFVLSYVLLAAFVGAFSDAFPKGRVMFVSNLIKIFGCGLMFFDVHPLLAYGVVGFGAAAYSPAKYGILTELLPAEKLVAANGWFEGSTVISIIMGTALGGLLVNPQVTALLLKFDIPVMTGGFDTTSDTALLVIVGAYVIAA
ncbi:MAG TPA: MFS transporter, partial [Burkholderiaceae bacterium]|nr:MFS transporter [Burkholderiaceae bacterium]